MANQSKLFPDLEIPKVQVYLQDIILQLDGPVAEGIFRYSFLPLFSLPCFVLFCFVLFCFVLFCFVLFCFVLFCFVLFCFVLFGFIILNYIKLKSILYYYIHANMIQLQDLSESDRKPNV